jgi:CubicO group peptidase (beta-lactamase class C family)
MKLIKLMWTIPIALCLSGAALADDLTTSGDPKSLGFSTARLARIAPWYQARFDSFSPSNGLVPGAVVAIAKGGKLAYLQAIGFQDRAKTIPMKTNSIFWTCGSRSERRTQPPARRNTGSICQNAR